MKLSVVIAPVRMMSSIVQVDGAFPVPGHVMGSQTAVKGRMNQVVLINAPGGSFCAMRGNVFQEPSCVTGSRIARMGRMR